MAAGQREPESMNTAVRRAGRAILPVCGYGFPGSGPGM